MGRGTAPGVLTVEGSALNDTLKVYRSGSDAWTVDVTTSWGGLSRRTSYYVEPDSSPDINSLNPFATAITQIVMRGEAGDDELAINSSFEVPLFAYGGSGDDLIRGGAANDFLFGQAGADILVGNDGNDFLWGDSPLAGADRDILIGGRGLDRMAGGPGEDIVISGWTDHDSSPTALRSLMAEWNSDTSRAFRMFHLILGKGGKNGSTFLRSSTVHDDGATDSVFSQGEDWVI